MQHQIAFRKLGRTTPHRRALLRNMVTSLIMKDRIQTTVQKAKELRRIADRMVTLGKSGTLAARRQAAAYINDPAAVQKLFADLAARFQDRMGGYTRIMRLGHRHGDAAQMAIIEYLPSVADVAAETPKKKPARRAPRPKKAAVPTKKAAKEDNN